MTAKLYFVAGLLSISSAAHADILTLSFTPDNNDAAVTFNIDSSVAPTTTLPGSAFVYEVQTTSGTVDAVFYNANYIVAEGLPANLDFALEAGSSVYVGAGPQLYTGSESSPLLTPGVYTLADVPLFANNGVFGGTLKITDNSLASAPEISASGTLSGLALLGGCALVLRERRRFSF